eukprot:6211112-Pleurochrysis_carterae.AAC.1
MATALRLMGSSYVLQFFGCSLIFCAFAHADSSCEPYLTATSLIEAASRQELTLATFPEAHRNVPNLTYVQVHDLAALQHAVLLPLFLPLLLALATLAQLVLIRWSARFDISFTA